MAAANSTNQQAYEFSPYNHQQFREIEPFLPSEHFERLAKMTMDIAGGLNVILEMLEQNSLDKECDGKQFLTPYAEGQLFRLAVRASGMLEEETCEAMSRVEKRHKIANLKK